MSQTSVKVTRPFSCMHRKTVSSTRSVSGTASSLAANALSANHQSLPDALFQPRQWNTQGVTGCSIMALTELWKTAHKEIQDKHVQQVIGFAGDGKLRDGRVASREFRDFLALVPSSFLSRYAEDCF